MKHLGSLGLAIAAIGVTGSLIIVHRRAYAQAQAWQAQQLKELKDELQSLDILLRDELSPLVKAALVANDFKALAATFLGLHPRDRFSTWQLCKAYWNQKVPTMALAIGDFAESNPSKLQEKAMNQDNLAGYILSQIEKCSTIERIVGEELTVTQIADLLKEHPTHKLIRELLEHRLQQQTPQPFASGIPQIIHWYLQDDISKLLKVIDKYKGDKNRAAFLHSLFQSAPRLQEGLVPPGSISSTN